MTCDEIFRLKKLGKGILVVSAMGYDIPGDLGGSPLLCVEDLQLARLVNLTYHCATSSVIAQLCEQQRTDNHAMRLSV